MPGSFIDAEALVGRICEGGAGGGEGGEFPFVTEHVASQLLNEPLDVSFVVKTKFAGVAEELDLFAEDKHAKAMKGGECDLFADGGADELFYAVAHFGGGFIGEGEPEYGLWIRPLANQVGDPVDDHAGFSTASPG